MASAEVATKIEALLEGWDVATRDEDASDAERLFARFTRALLSVAGERVFRTHDDEALRTVVQSAFAFYQQRPQDDQLVRVSSPPDLPGRSVIDIAQSDRPFLVDTVRLFLRRAQLKEQLFLHPTLRVVRDADGRLEWIDRRASARESEDASDVVHESFIHVEVFPRLEPERAREIEAGLRDVMNAVAHVTDDHHRMIRAVREIQANVEYAGRELAVEPERVTKICRFLDWLVEDHFVFMGVRQYDVQSIEGELAVSIRPAESLGMWRGDHGSRFAEAQRGADLPPGLQRALEDPRIIQLGKGWLESRIHRAGRLDRIFVKEHDETGRVSGFHIVSGLFTYNALRTPSSRLPLLAERLEQILEADGAPERSHRHKALVTAFDSTPMEFLLGTDVEHNARLVGEIVEAEGSEDPKVVLHTDADGRSFYAAVILPRERYSEVLRRRIRSHLEQKPAVGYLDDRVSFLEEGTALIHFFGTLATDETPDVVQLEDEVQRMAASWDDALTDALIAHYGAAEGGELAARYVDAFPEGLAVTTHPADAVRDVLALEALHHSGQPQIALYIDQAARNAATTMLRLYLDEDRLLSDLLPIVDQFGIRVSDARQTRIEALDRPPVYLHALRVLPLGASQADLDEIVSRLGDALRAVLTGVAANDLLNGLVLGAGLDWRQVDLLRSYIEYLIQIQTSLTRRFVSEVLLQNPSAVRLLLAYHEARLAPGADDEARRSREKDLAAGFAEYRDRIESLNEDRALGAIFELIDATLRTSFFAPLEGPHRIATKLDPSRLAELLPPHPHREIFVHGPGVEGIHLRGGVVARGGLRWSDRRDDFRTEVLGLMRTQQLKNGLIVPVGAKGGFVLTSIGLTPREARAEADAKYETFISALLDVTDDRDAEGRVVAPRGVYRRDGPDTYLVVAADKGTAHLSDTANRIAKQRGFWLGDAFASGGSVGYDHKKYAITARGAWECVRHHFAELGLDPEADEYRVVGIGDMSGDVFGNGLLLMRNARLIAAFDHRHVFVDPNPDPGRAWAERKRLFELPRSTWDDYDRALISAGGGVFSRSAKRIELSPEARESLGVEAATLTGPELVRAVLSAPVDLIWNGGIGTYVKASHESDAEVGDRSNDSVRIDAPALRARVVGEGGNLGWTQAGRVEAGLAGVRIDSDAIHNSAGVDLSDHEVNFKILFAPLVQSGALDEETRVECLFDLAETACESVLDHNRAQSLSLSIDEMRSRRDLDPFRWAIDVLCEAQGVDRDELGLPSEPDLDRRQEAGLGLVRPELAVLLGLAKLHVRLSLAGDDSIDSPDLEPLYHDYFPPALRERFGSALAGHRLRREVTALQVANRIVDTGGVTAIASLIAKRGIDVPTAAAAWLAADAILDGERQRASLVESMKQVEIEVLERGLLELDASLGDVARYLIAEDLASATRERTAVWSQALFELADHAADILSPEESERLAERRDRLAEAGIPEPMVERLSVAPLATRGLNVLRLAEATQRQPLELAPAYVRLGERTGIHWVYRSLPTAQTANVWDRIVLTDLRTGMLSLQRELTERAFAARPGDPLAAVDAFLDEHGATIERVHALAREARETPTASTLTVVTQTLMRLRATNDPDEGRS